MSTQEHYHRCLGLTVYSYRTNKVPLPQNGTNLGQLWNSKTMTNTGSKLMALGALCCRIDAFLHKLTPAPAVIGTHHNRLPQCTKDDTLSTSVMEAANVPNATSMAHQCELYVLLLCHEHQDHEHAKLNSHACSL